MNYTHEEFIKYKINNPKIQDFCFSLIDKNLEAETERYYSEKELERTKEQLNSCLEFIEFVLEECNKKGSKKYLVGAIKTTFENSYIEL